MAVGNKFAELQGLNYVPNDAYLQEGFTGSEPLDFSNISSSGIMSQAPIIYPPINQGGGEGGGDNSIITNSIKPDPGITPDDYGYGLLGNDPSMNMTEEEQAGVDSIKNARMSKMDLVKAGLSTMFLGPLAGGSSLYRSQKKAKKEAVAAAKAAQQQRDRDAEVKSIQGRLDSGMSLGDIGRESYTGPGMAFEERDTGTGRGPKKDGGRAGYFFGGRVNYKAGGRTDAGPNRTTASHSTRGQINESGQQVSGGQTTRDNNDGGNSPFYGPKPTFFNSPEIISEKTILGNVPKGVAFNNDMGRYKAIMDLKNSIKKQGVEGEIEYNNSIGDFDLAAKYSTQDGPGYGVGYTGNNFDVNVDNQTGASANYSKDIFDGRGKITAGGTYNPDGTYNAEGKIIFNYANGGLASIL